MKNVPFTQVDYFIRTFDENVSEMELIWHKDKEDRTVEIIESKNWKIQIDNLLPVILSPLDVIKVPKDTYHRVIKGCGSLVIKIYEKITVHNHENLHLMRIFQKLHFINNK